MMLIECLILSMKNFISFYEKDLANNEFGFCTNCSQPQTDDEWCRVCSSMHFKQSFDKWKSGNIQIDMFIQESQKKARNYKEVIEWIPYDRLRNVKYLAKGGFSIVYKAIW